MYRSKKKRPDSAGKEGIKGFPETKEKEKIYVV